MAALAVAGVFATAELTTPQFTVTLEDSEGGTVLGEGTYRHGSTVTLEASSELGYVFSCWTDGGDMLSCENPYTFIAEEDRVIEPVFTAASFSLSLSSNMDGGMVSGDGVYPAGASAALSVDVNDGYVFNGWYCDGDLISPCPVISYTVTGDSEIRLEYGILHDASFTVTGISAGAPCTLLAEPVYDIGISKRTWTVKDLVTERTVYSSTSDGSLRYQMASGSALKISHRVEYTDGQRSTASEEVIVDGITVKTFEWRYQQGIGSGDYNDRSGKIDLHLSFSWYYGYVTDDVPRSGAGAKNSVDRYVTDTDPCIADLARQLCRLTGDMSDLERINCTLKFVQSIEYRYDKDSEGAARGDSEYWKYPAETLWEMHGDCEDHAMLFSALLRAMDYDDVLLKVHCYKDGRFAGAHMATGVNVEGATGTFYSVDGKDYYYCETTADAGKNLISSANVGYIPEEYRIMGTY
ncbi:MAG: hypothetical protein GX583_01430 [Thermoplasmatales archaeon]|nr:hypothetical protein [Thermoplasmatales archaeon]